MTSEGFVCITLNWLYDNIEKRTKKAEENAHKKFLAARAIERNFRKWKERNDQKNNNKAAIIIQKWWRGYMARNYYYFLLEETLNQRTWDWYNYNATIIQKWWRGYITRLKVHDHNKMKRLQKDAAKELILCIAYKLHHLLRTNRIPGVYSMRNSKCLSRVEQLLASLKFKEYNETVRRIRAEKAKILADSNYRSRMSEYKTKIPFGPPCPKFYKETKIDKMLSMLDTVGPIRKKRAIHVKPPQKAGLQPKVSACDGVINSMKRWNIVKDEQDLAVSPHIVNQPDNIDNFLGDIETICTQQRFIRGPICSG